MGTGTPLLSRYTLCALDGTRPGSSQEGAEAAGVEATRRAESMCSELPVLHPLIKDAQRDEPGGSCQWGRGEGR